MGAERPLPREVKVIDSASLLRLEERAGDLGLSQRLDPVWVRANAAPGGSHYLWPFLWHTLSHRSDVPDHVRWELLISLRTGGRVVSWLDVVPDDFTPLPSVTSREEGRQVRRLFGQAPSVRDWLLREGGGAGPAVTGVAGRRVRVPG
ncbi:hypothetical protein [Streptomyces anulatus]|uniref:hypothetical protein n=1 Tax=Streptomyces anulatus TaxID=1892 RepID=UPI001C273D0C|nr:hypothetical protein [Streptomyces anulatus]